MPVKSMMVLAYLDSGASFCRIVKQRDSACLSIILSETRRFGIPFSSTRQYSSYCCFSSTSEYILIIVKIVNKSFWVKWGPYSVWIWKINPLSKKNMVIAPKTDRIFLFCRILEESDFRSSSMATRILAATKTDILRSSSGLKLSSFYRIAWRVFSGIKLFSKAGSFNILHRVWPRTSSKILWPMNRNPSTYLLAFFLASSSMLSD